MGEVFEARHVITGRAVALKLLFEAASDDEGQISGRFLREARAAGALNSDNLVHVVDAGTDAKSRRNYLVMELLHGENLLDLVKRVGPLPPRLALCIAGQAAVGLGKAHAHGVIHRDIKPANIFLAIEGQDVVVKVLDFGIAKIASLGDSGHHPVADLVADPATQLTQVGAIVGSPHYMSPEQAQGLKTLDHRSDLYSLGAVLYRLLAGKTPHAGVETLVRLLAVICSEPARPLIEIAPWVPDPVSRLVDHAVAIDPEQRYASADEMVADIVSLVGDLRIDPHEIGALASSPGVIFPSSLSPVASHGERGLEPAAMQGQPVRAQELVGSPRRGSLATSIVLAVGLGLMLIGGVGFWRMRAMGANTTPPSPPQAKSDTVDAAAIPQDTRRAWVRVQPANVPEIVVDGRRVTVTQAGYIEVTGAIGSRHQIVLREGDHAGMTDVILAQEGPQPDTVILAPATASASSSGSAHATGPKSHHSSHHSKRQEELLQAIPPPPMPPPRDRPRDDDMPPPTEIPLSGGNLFKGLD